MRRAPSGGISIRRAELEDAAELLELERSSPEAPHWSEGVWAQMLAGSGSVARSMVALSGPQRVCLVAVRDREIAGFVVVGVVSGGSFGRSTAEMESLLVREGLRRQGIAQALCEQAMLWSMSLGADTMQLEVRCSNAGALRLYERLGFEEQGRRKAYYRDPTEDGVLLGLRLSGEAEGWTRS